MALENASIIALSRQMVLGRRLDMIANNIANMNTASYKAQRMMFVEYLAQLDDGSEIAYVQDIGQYRDTSEGDLIASGNDLDIAIRGEGYFTVGGPGGNFYTRNGRFTLDANGQIVTSTGLPVLGDKGPITIPEDTTKITIAPDGTISVARLGQDNANLNEEGVIGRIQIVTFDDEQELRKIGNGLYETSQLGDPSINVHLAQGMFESSNVKPVIEMTKMIETHHAYISAQSIINNEHDLERSAIDKLTRAV